MERKLKATRGARQEARDKGSAVRAMRILDKPSYEEASYDEAGESDGHRRRTDAVIMNMYC